MKKLALSSLLVFSFAVALTSCKSHEKCAAYSKANTQVSPKKSI